MLHDHAPDRQALHDAGAPAVITLAMSLSEDEFRSNISHLPLESESVSELSANHWMLLPDGVRIHARPLSALKTGSLTLPRLEVIIDLSALPDATAREGFMRRFRRVFLRGGG